jgi:photosystem II stability/assembly factor-like uncharacterized protein
MKRFFSLVCVVVVAGSVQSMAQATWVKVNTGLSGDMGVVAAATGRDLVVAGASNHAGLYSTTDGGTTWTKLGAGGENGTTQIVFDPIAPDTFWACGIYGSPICVTRNGGISFKAMGSISHNDGLAVDFTDPLRRVVLVAGHETKQLLNKTVDDGANWTNIGANLPDSASLVVAPVAIDSLTYLVACSGWAGTGTGGIWRTTDGGNAWTIVCKTAPVRPPLVCANGNNIFYCVLYDNGLLRSTDQGQHWTQLYGYGVIHDATPVELPDGRIVCSSFSTLGLSVAPPTGFGFKNIGPRTPARVSSLCYDAVRKAFFVSCPGSGVYRLDYDSTVIASVQVPFSAPVHRGGQTVFRCSGNSFTIPAMAARGMVIVSFYSAGGRFIARAKGRPGETIRLPDSQAEAFFMAKLASVAWK